MSTETNKLHRVGSLTDVKAGKPTIARVDKKFIAAFWVEGKVVATQGRCPHASGPIHEGTISGCKLTCPWHGWSFDLSNGVCDEDPDMILERFDVTIQGDDIMVTV